MTEFPVRERGLALIPRSPFLIWLNLAITFVVAAISFGPGFAQGLSAQLVILYTLISCAVLFWLINYIAVVSKAGPRHRCSRRRKASSRSAVAGCGGTIAC